jgi:2-methylisocitrate lyase-like PEP mutase family enzyme
VIERSLGVDNVVVPTNISFFLAAEEHCAACEAEYEEGLQEEAATSVTHHTKHTDFGKRPEYARQRSSRTQDQVSCPAERR